MKEIKTSVLEFTQPIGTFYLGKINAANLEGCIRINRRSESALGQQRDLGNNRLKEIVRYCDDPDATFPTAVILSVDADGKDVKCFIEDGEMTILFSDTFGEIIDGQHRLLGIWDSNKASEFELPVVFMINPTVQEKAYIFSIINSKQTKVNQSLIYDLFDVSLTRSPRKTVHELARALNGRTDSPFYNRLKMLGKASEEQWNATLSQGTFSKRILSLISRNPEEDAIRIKNNKPLLEDTSSKLIFREYFVDNRDDVILKILINCFNALKEVFPELWNNPKNNILWKTTGFNAIIDSLPEMYNFGISRKSLTEDIFIYIFEAFKSKLNEWNLKLTSEYFGSGESETRRLKELIINSIPQKSDWE